MRYLRIAFCTLLAACCAASQPAPELAPNAPVALKAGRSIEVTLTGSHLQSLSSIALADPRGVIATLTEPPKDGQLKLKITAASDAAIGERQFRLTGPAGVTRPVRLVISSYDVQTLTASDQPQDVALPATVIGQVAAAGQLHQFRFQGKKGELLIFDLSARRTGSPLEAVVTIQDLSGRQLRTTLERHGNDPVVLFTPPEDGSYVLRLRDLRFRGGAEYGFAINAGHIPYLESVTPGSGKPGTLVKAKAVGYNMDGAEPISIDLAHVGPGRINVHATTSLGISNEIPFEVTDLPQFAEAEPNDSPDEANLVQLPIEISAAADRAADEDFFRFRLPYKQPVSLEVLAARFGSPMVPLLQLRNAKGELIEANDGTPDSDGRIIRELDAGEYLASVRDLAYSGGPGHWYRLKIEPARSLQPDFVVRFQPDAPRLHRGGSVAIWFDVRRTNRLRGDITLAPQSLPPGITVSPLTLPENGSGWLTLSATMDAPLGTVPLRLGAQAASGMAMASHDPQSDAYVTILEPAPFTLQTTANLTSQQIEEANARLASLAAKLATPDPRLEAAEAQWEKKIPTQSVWQPLEAASVSSAKGAKMLRLSDSSILATGNIPDQDEYTVVAHTNLKGITAIRLEAISDPRLPASGPGTAPNGNFVLSRFSATVARGSESQPVALRRATSDFAQEGFLAQSAIAAKPGAGWAIDPQEGRTHTAIFRAMSPVGAGPDTTLTFALVHQSAFARHNLGRFRISVTTLDPSMLNDVTDVPPAILAAVAVPVDQRTPQQKSQIAAYYRTIDPELAATRNQVAALRSFVGPQAELQRLQVAMVASTPQLEADQKQWEQAVAQGGAWTLLQSTSLASDSGASLTREADGSIFAQRGNGSDDVYHITATTPLKSITAIRLEALPDPRLPANGPGRADDGSFSISNFEFIGKDSGEPLILTRAHASADQKDSAMWSPGPSAGLPVEATFRFDRPVTDASKFTISLHQPAKRSLGRFRLWVTANPNPDAAMRIPDAILAALKTPDATRPAGQKRQVTEYFRNIAPSLTAMRERLAELRGQTTTVPPQARRNQPTSIPVLVNRAAGFKGNLTVTLEGYAPGNPKMIVRQIKVTPLALNGEAIFGILTIQPEAAAELATRMVVLKAETKMGDDTITQYSPAFPLTIQN